MISHNKTRTASFGWILALPLAEAEAHKHYMDSVERSIAIFVNLKQDISKSALLLLRITTVVVINYIDPLHIIAVCT